MNSWIVSVIGWLVGLAPGVIKNVVRNIGELIRSVFNWANAALNAVNKGLANLSNYASKVARSLSGFAGEVWDTVNYIYNTFVPEWSRWALNTARAFASTGIANARQLLDFAIRTARDGLKRLIDNLSAFVNDIVDWAVARFRDATNLLNSLKGALAHVLGGAGVLAEWLIGALVSALWRYVQRNELHIGRWFRDRSLAFTLWSANRLESIIARLL